MTSNDEILTVREAAKLLKVCDKTMYDWTHRADFPALKLGNTTRIPRTLLLEWVNAQAAQKRGIPNLV